MRVIAGTAKGKRLLSPKGEAVTRPTTDKVKEAIFGKLQFRMPDASILDLFAGSGALGIEALSRGAEQVVFVDKAKEAIMCLKQNLAATNFAKQATVLHRDAKQAIHKFSAMSFDFIFLDPPYAAGLYEEVLDAIFRCKLLKPNGLVIVEHDERTCLDRYKIDSQKRYGTTYVSYISVGEND